MCTWVGEREREKILSFLTNNVSPSSSSTSSYFYCCNQIIALDTSWAFKVLQGTHGYSGWPYMAVMKKYCVCYTTALIFLTFNF